MREQHFAFLRSDPGLGLRLSGGEGGGCAANAGAGESLDGQPPRAPLGGGGAAASLVLGDRAEQRGGSLQVGAPVLLVLVEGHDAEVVRGGELDDVGEGDADVLLGDEGAEGLAQLLEDLGVALEQRDAW